jgi:hypothetical protein
MLQLWTAIKVLHYSYPALVFFYFITALTITVCTLQTQRLRIKDEHVRRDVILGLIFGVTVTYVRFRNLAGNSFAPALGGDCYRTDF